MKYAFLAGLVLSGLVYAAYRGPYASRLPISARWFLVGGLIVFIYSLGVWVEILWLRSTNPETTLLSMVWERRWGALVLGAFAALIAWIATHTLSNRNRALIIIVAMLAGAITGTGAWELVDLIKES